MNRPGSKLSPISRGAAIALLIALAGGRAHAQTEADKKRAQSLQIEGVQLLDRGENRAALRKFEEAIRIFPSPKIRFNMGRAHAALGNEVEALDDFERFLDEAPYAPKQSRDEAQRIVESLRPKLSYLDIITDDTGAHIAVDGKEVGVAPLGRPLPTTPGAHQVRLEKADMIAETRDVAPVAGQKVRVVVKLRPMAAPVAESKPPAVTRPPPPPPPASDQDETPAGSRARDRDRDRTRVSERAGGETAPPPPPRIREPDAEPALVGSSAGRRSLKWIAWGLAAGGAALGTYGFLSNRSGVSEFNQWCGFFQGSVMPDSHVPNNMHSAQDCINLRDRYETGTQLAVGGLVSAGVLAVAGVVLWATETDAPHPARETAARVACVPVVGVEAGVACALRF